MLRLEVRDTIAIVTLDRPEALNALSQALRVAIAEVFRAVDRDEAVRVVVLTGAGRGFCAGLDLKELPEGIDPSQPDADPVAAIQQCSKPVIGAINGPAVTGGFELAMACDILIGSTEARFADTHVRVGILPGWGLSQKLSRAVGLSRAKEIAFSGNYVDAERAVAWGLMNRAVEPERLLDEALALARDIATAPQHQLRRYKGLIDAGYEMPLGAGLLLEGVVSSLSGELATREEIAANLKDVFLRGRRQAGSRP